MINIKEAVKENRKVRFSYYFDGNLYYTTETGHTFPVPISDVGTATFLAEDKALLFMRYMRQWNKNLESNIKSDSDHHL